MTKKTFVAFSADQGVEGIYNANDYTEVLDKLKLKYTSRVLLRSILISEVDQSQIESPWQDIETAPIDGTPIMLLFTKKKSGRHGNKGRFAIQGYCKNMSWYDFTNRLIQGNITGDPAEKKGNTVTHWMPLTKLPNE